MVAGKQIGHRRARIRVALFGAAPGSADTGYDRRRDLPRLLPLYLEDLEIGTPEAQHRLVGRLRSALRAERTRGKHGHWSYDIGRHSALLRAFRCEQALLEAGGTNGRP